MVGDGPGVEEAHFMTGGAVASSEELASLRGASASGMGMGKCEEEDVFDVAAMT